MPHRKAAVGPTAQLRGDLVRPGLYDNSSWEQILVILEEKGLERNEHPETDQNCSTGGHHDSNQCYTARQQAVS